MTSKERNSSERAFAEGRFIDNESEQHVASLGWNLLDTLEPLGTDELHLHCIRLGKKADHFLPDSADAALVSPVVSCDHFG